MSDQDEQDVDCASCSYAIKDFSTVVQAPCGHGWMHYNCSYFNNECAVCESKLTLLDGDSLISFRGKDSGEGSMKMQLLGISSSLMELKHLLKEQKQKQEETHRLVVELSGQLEAKDGQLEEKDETISQLQKEIFELKLKKVESLKLELEEKLKNLKSK